MIWLVGCPNDREVVSLGLLRRNIRSVLSGKASGIKKHGKYEFHLYKYMEKINDIGVWYDENRQEMRAWKPGMRKRHVELPLPQTVKIDRRSTRGNAEKERRLSYTSTKRGSGVT